MLNITYYNDRRCLTGQRLCYLREQLEVFADAGSLSLTVDLL
jgi:hypothetical protein